MVITGSGLASHILHLPCRPLPTPSHSHRLPQRAVRTTKKGIVFLWETKTEANKRIYIFLCGGLCLETREEGLLAGRTRVLRTCPGRARTLRLDDAYDVSVTRPELLAPQGALLGLARPLAWPLRTSQASRPTYTLLLDNLPLHSSIPRLCPATGWIASLRTRVVLPGTARRGVAALAAVITTTKAIRNINKTFGNFFNRMT